MDVISSGASFRNRRVFDVINATRKRCYFTRNYLDFPDVRYKMKFSFSLEMNNLDR